MAGLKKNKKTRPVARQDSSPELALINEVKNYNLKILIIVSVVCVHVCVWGVGWLEGGRKTWYWI